MSDVTAAAPRLVTASGAAVAAASFAAVLVILGFYFAGHTPPAVWFWVALWGFPVGFLLMCTAMMVSLVRRRRSRHGVQPAH